MYVLVQKSSAVTPEEVEALLGADNETEHGKQVNNNHSNNATEVSVVAKPQSEADHSNDDEDGAYNIVPTEVLAKKLRTCCNEELKDIFPLERNC